MIAVFGGAFNPPTIAHYNVARHILNLDFIDELIFLPVGDHYEKDDLVTADHRVKMLKIMSDLLPGSTVCDLEVNYSKALKTIESLIKLQVLYPNKKLGFVMGADNLYKLSNWNKSEELISNFTMIILNRDDLDVEEIINNSFYNYKKNFIIINDFEKIDISSSKYRNNINEAEILHPAVVKYIKEEGLYG